MDGLSQLTEVESAMKWLPYQRYHKMIYSSFCTKAPVLTYDSPSYPSTYWTEVARTGPIHQRMSVIFFLFDRLPTLPEPENVSPGYHPARHSINFSPDRRSFSMSDTSHSYTCTDSGRAAELQPAASREEAASSSPLLQRQTAEAARPPATAALQQH